MTRGHDAPLVRSSGVLLHITSLPSGRLGPDAYEFVDWLAAAGQSWWQVLPLGPPDPFGSPYTSASAFAGWRGLLGEPDAAVTRAEIADFHGRHAYWIADWEHYADADAVVDQVRFEREWLALRRYASGRGVRLIGDLPIYVAAGGADASAHPELFVRGFVAGAAPDVSHPDGQLWGQPVYDWPEMRRQGYRWWIERFRRSLELFDLIRIDHFRGFVAAWVVPVGAASPLEGRWRRSPGRELFDAAHGELGRFTLIAEDLGLITPAVDRLRVEIGALSMRIVGRGFIPRHRRRHAVAAHAEDAVVYTGTHDHSTMAGWLANATPDELALMHEDLAAAHIEGHGAWSLVRLALSSRARIAVLPLQDVLELGNESRMNAPGTVRAENWSWRVDRDALTPEVATKLRAAATDAGRVRKRALANAAS